MNASPHPRLDELFVRYWDNALTPAEADELAALLASDPVAREWFQFLAAQAVTAAELLAAPVLGEERMPVLPQPSVEPRRWSRRKILSFVGGGLAAGIGGVVFGRWFWGGGDAENRDTGVMILKSHGTVLVRGADGSTNPAAESVPTGATIATQGYNSTATLAYPDGSKVLVLGDSALTVQENGRLLLLQQGTASAELRPRKYDQRLTLTTSLLTLAHVNDTAITVGQGRKSSEVEVHHGSVSVSAPTGEPMAVVREGEMLTVGVNGVHTQQPVPVTPDEFSWNLTVPLPEGWLVGHRETVDGTPVIRCEAWPDPYYNGTVMHQIRSNQQWGRGLFRLVENSTVNVRYRAKRSSPKGQVCFCVRTPDSWRPETGMLEYNGGFEATEPGEWRWLRMPAASMLPNKHTPAFGAPWVGFLVIFNTFEPDVGLEIAEFRVSPPGK